MRTTEERILILEEKVASLESDLRRARTESDGLIRAIDRAVARIQGELRATSDFARRAIASPGSFTGIIADDPEPDSEVVEEDFASPDDILMRISERSGNISTEEIERRRAVKYGR